MPSTLAAEGSAIQGNYRFVNTQLSGSRGTIAHLRIAALDAEGEPREPGSNPVMRIAVPGLAEVTPRRRRRGPEMTQQPGEHRAFSGETEHGNCSSRPRPEPGR